MATPPGLTRHKISTTISPSAFAYFERLIATGEARNLADAIDLAVRRLQAYENRERLARDTAAYFDGMSLEQVEEENRLGAALAAGVKGIDFDREP